MKKEWITWARVVDNTITHCVSSKSDWIDRNPWPDVPGIWIVAPATVTTAWTYNSETQEFTPP
jgi:hypothetical protein